MTIGIAWLIPERVIYQYHEGELTTAMLNESVPFVLDMMNRVQSPHPIHLINDLSALTVAPAFGQMRDAINPVLKHPKMGWVINVQQQSAVLVSFFSQLLRFRLKLVHSYDEAIEALRLLDPSLQAISEWPTGAPMTDFIKAF